MLRSGGPRPPVIRKVADLSTHTHKLTLFQLTLIHYLLIIYSDHIKTWTFSGGRGGGFPTHDK
jgi:hypothetical protein